MPSNWESVDVSGDPRMLLGWRKSSKKIEVKRVTLHEELFEDLRAIARAGLAELGRREAKSYAPFGAITADDYFDIDVSDLPKRRNRRKPEDAEEAYSIASAVRMISDTDVHPRVTAEELRDSKRPNLYAIVFERGEDGYVGFVRNVSPQKPLKPGLRFLQYGATLRRLDTPDLAIDDETDVVVTSDRCAVLTSSAFNTLFGDVGVAFQRVPQSVTSISDAMKGTLPLTPKALQALRERCGRRVIDAKRLHHIVSERHGALKAMKRENLIELLDKRGLKKSVKDNTLALAEDDISEFLDLIEGRLFEDDVTGEEKRADAYSPRRR